MTDRQIEFRGRTREGMWVYGDLINSSGGIKTFIGVEESKDKLNFYLKDNTPCYYYEYEVDPSTVGQFVRMIGKKKAFEGDLFQTDEDGEVALTFKDGCFGFEVERWSSTQNGEEAYSVFLTFENDATYWELFHNCGLKIIGNIHDSPRGKE
jgi:hypothetical protein